LLALAGAVAAPATWAQQSPSPSGASAQAQEPPPVLPPVLVTAPTPLPELLPRSSVPGALDILTPRDIRDLQPRVLPDAMEHLTGVTLSNEQGTPYQPDLTLRGFVASPVTGLPQGISVFLDGVRLNEPTVEEVNFDLIPLDDIESVEVIRGTSVLFGRNTLGAALSLTTRRGQDVLELVPELSYGSFGLQNYTLRVGGSAKPFDYYIGARYTDDGGWRDDSSARIGRVFSKVGIRIGDLDATVSYQYTNNNIKEPGSLPASEVSRDPTANFTPGDFFKPVLNMGVINASYALSEQIKLEANAFVRSLSVDQFNVNLSGPNTELFNNSVTTGGRLQASHRGSIFGFDNTLVVGAEYTWSHVSSRTFVDDPDEGQEIDADLTDTQQSVGAYIQNTITLLKDFAGKGSSLILTTAGRWDYLRHDIDDLLGGPSGGVFTYNRFDPKVGINFNLNENVGFYFSYGESFRAPAFLELTCAGPGAVCPGLQAGVAPDPPLQAVVARTYEIGAYTHPFPWLDVSAALYRTDVSNDIYSVSPTGTVGLFFQNVGSTRRQGAEFNATARWDKMLEAYLNYAYTDATFQQQFVLGTSLPPGTETVPAGSSLPMIPKQRINFGAALHPWPWLTLSLGATYVSSQFFRGDEANTQRPLPSYWVVNAGLSARWRGLEVFANINNLLDNKYETFGTFAPNPTLPGSPVVPFVTPAPPINVVGGLRYVF